MKNSIILFMVALLASCSNQQLLDSIAEVKESELVKENANGNAEINALVERARWGDGQAYLQLADCYRDGIGVKKDFLGMISMIGQALSLGAIHDGKEYMAQMLEGSDIKRLLVLMDKTRSQLMEDVDSVKAQLAAMDSPDALAVFGIICAESGDSIRGFEIIREAAGQGSNFAALINVIPDMDVNHRPDMLKLEQLAERTPLAYKLLGRFYLEPDDNGKTDERKAAYYYMKADEHALLSQRDVRWLLAYHEDVGIPQLTDEDVIRLKAYIRLPDNKDEYMADSVSVDSIYQDNKSHCP